MTLLFNIIFDGLALGMLLFIITVGLSVTMGVMNFVNLAHGAFAMGGGYGLVLLIGQGVGFFPAIALIAVAFFAVGAVLEAALFRHFYRAGPLVQVLMTIGLVYMSIAAVTYVFGPLSAGIAIPEYLRGRMQIGPFGFPVYRAMIIVFGTALALILWVVLEHTMVGAQVRAAVSNRTMAENIGINVPALFSVLFGIGAALAAVGGALSIEVVGLTPSYALTFLVLVLLIVIIGGMGSIRGTLAAALVVGVLDNAGKFLMPHSGAFLIYIMAFAILLWRPRGLIPGAAHE